MNKSDTQNKILVAIDGSKQAMEAVHYVATIFPPATTRVVLFHVSEPISDLFDDLKNNQLYQSKLPGLRNWVADEQKHIAEYMQQASTRLLDSGFTKEQIEVKIVQKKVGIVRDIVKESYDDYNAVVVGRTGVSRFKDFLLKSVYIKLVGQVKHIPVVVMGGAPVSKRVCIGYDGSDSAMKGVACISSLLGGSDCNIQILCLLSQKDKFWVNGEAYCLPAGTDNAFEEGAKVIGPCAESAKNRLIKAGIPNDNIAVRIEILNTDPAERIVNEVTSCGFGSVVISRRSLVSFFDEAFVGRVSKKVLKKADSVAVWII